MNFLVNDKDDLDTVLNTKIYFMLCLSHCCLQSIIYFVAKFDVVTL